MAISKEELLRADFWYWLKEKWLLPSGEPYTFKDHEYLEQIVKHKWAKGDQVFAKKAAQVGVSEIFIAFPIWQNDRNLPYWQGSGYFFPARSQLQDHMKARLFPAFEHENERSLYLRKKLGNHNLRYVNFNGKPIFFRSGQTRRELISIALDCAVIDEFDEFENPIQVVPTLEMRFMHSRYGYLLGGSTPTIPDTGVDEQYNLSNQYQWFVDCERCHKEFCPLLEVQTSGFGNCVDEAKGKFGFKCPVCSEITQTNGAPGRWRLVEKKDNQKHAYAISRLFTKGHSLKKLFEKFNEALNQQEFYNSVLGIAYTAENARLTRAVINECCIGPEKHQSQSVDAMWMGVDVGIKCYWVVGKPDGNHKRIIAYGSCSFEQLDEIARRFNVQYCVVDLRPYEQEVKKFIGGRRGFRACDFNTGNQEDRYKLLSVDNETSDKAIRIIKADKTQNCDILIREIMFKKSFIFPGSARGDNIFVNQMCAPVRMDKTNEETGDTKAVYGNGGKADHYFFAMLYFLLACELKRGFTVKLGKMFS